MNVYACTACYDCKYVVFLGIAAHYDEIERSYRSLYFERKWPNYRSDGMTKLLWKFMADHRLHKLRFMDESHKDFGMMADFADIDIDLVLDHSFEEYMKNWPGLIEKPADDHISVDMRIACKQCKLFLSLGEVMQQADDSSVYVKSPGIVAPYEKKAVHMALWKLLAEHMQHDIRVIDESSSDYKDTDTYWDIGNTQRKGITLIRYLEGWGG